MRREFGWRRRLAEAAVAEVQDGDWLSSIPVHGVHRGHLLPRRAVTFSTAKVPTRHFFVFALYLPTGQAMSRNALPDFFHRKEPLAARREDSVFLHFFFGSLKAGMTPACHIQLSSTTMGASCGTSVSATVSVSGTPKTSSMDATRGC